MNEDLLAAVEALPGRHRTDAGVAWDVSNRVDEISRAAVLALLRSAPASREAGLDAEAVSAAARDMRITADDIYGAIRDLGRAGSRAEAIVFACAEAVAARLATSPVPAEKPEPK